MGAVRSSETQQGVTTQKT